MKRLNFSTFLILLAASQTVFAVTPGKFCTNILAKLGGSQDSTSLDQAAQVTKPFKIESFEDLLQVFTQGYVPDLNNKTERDAFEIYRRMRFGNPETNLGADTITKIQAELKKYPELKKEPFRNYELNVQEKSYPVTKALKDFLESMQKSAGQVRSNLYQIEANLGFWRKVLDYKDETPQIPNEQLKALPKEDQKRLKEEEKQRFLTVLDRVVPQEHRAKVADNDQPAKARASVLIADLIHARDWMLRHNRDTKAISQAIVDLVHTIGFFDPLVAQGLKSASGLDRLNAFRRAMSERDSFAMELGYENHFEQVLTTFNVKFPTGFTSPDILTKRLPEIESEIMSQAQIIKNSGSERDIRHLSIVESSFRSCLGGSDCSSRTYLTRALDPNYHYFTLTDAQGYSMGHFTIVLGEAEAVHSNGTKSKQKMAFIDKIQNVTNQDIPLMAEGIRRSLAEKGYVLALPEDVGDHNGLSNEDMTRNFVKGNVKLEQDVRFINFTPHQHKYKFPNQYSRAEQKLPSRPVKAITLGDNVALSPGKINEPWKANNYDLKELAQASIKLKDGTPEEKLRYLPSMKILKSAGLGEDPKMNQTLQKWMSDPNESFQLRRQVLLHYWKEESKPLGELLKNFDKAEQANIVQNLLDTPRYRNELLKNKNQILSLLIQMKDSAGVRMTLAKSYSSLYGEKIDKIMNSHEIENDKLEAVIKQVDQSYSAMNLEEASKLLTLLEGTRIKDAVKDDLAHEYLKKAVPLRMFSRELVNSLFSSVEPARRELGLAVLKEAKGSQAFADSSIIPVVDEILSKNNGNILEWVESDVPVELKAELLHLLAITKNARERFTKHLSTKEKSMIEEFIADRTSSGDYERAASKKLLKATEIEKAMERAKPEIFEFESVRMTGPGHKYMMGEGNGRREVTLTKPFEVMLTPVTQLQWFLVMGENPSYFRAGQYHDPVNGIVLNGHSINPNHPVEQVSWDDVQKFIAKLNKASDKYVYRLPTEAEWEFFARAGTDTAFSFGDEESKMDEYGWYQGNAGSKTHAVAEKKPNPFGLYDIHGNVWEWVNDWYGSLDQRPVTDPQGPTAGSYRVLRGGGWYNDAQFLRSAFRGLVSPGVRVVYVGFRLVRTAK